jgi:hypothetical protein
LIVGHVCPAGHARVNNRMWDTTLKLSWQDWGNSRTLSTKISPHDSLSCIFGIIHRLISKQRNLCQRVSCRRQNPSELN